MNADVAKGLVVLLLLVVLFFLVVFGPVFTIWSLNLLFGLEIPVDFSTWCAVIWLTTVLHGIKINFKKND